MNKSNGRSNYIRLILFLGLSLSIIFIFSGAASAATTPVDNNTNALQDAINNASDGDTLELSAGNYYEHDITVDKNLTIEGPTVAINSTPKAVIDSQGQGRVFYIVSGVTVNLEYLLIQNGNAATNSSNQFGGGIRNYGTLNLQNSYVQNNTATYGGGGIANWGVMTITDSNIYNNIETGGNGGGIDNWNIINLNDTNLYNNTAIGYGGGIENDEGLTNINCSNIYSNTATMSGGGIDNYANSQSGTVNMDNTNIYSNTANTNGGGLNDNIGGIIVINNSQIYNNIANRGSISGGGGIYDIYGTISINNTSIYGNNAIMGGGILNNEGIISMDQSNIYQNTGRNYGGGIVNVEYGNTFFITNSNIYSNTALFGGGIDNYHGNLFISTSNLCNNTATVYGGGVYNENGGILNITDSNIINNIAVVGTGSAVYNLYNSLINFNRIMGSGTLIEDASGTVDATNNWWGSNNSPSGEVSPGVNVNTWLVLNTNASPNRVTPGGISNITADLTHDQNGIYYNPINGHVPDGIPVTFSSTLRTLNPTSTIIINGIGTSVYTAGIITGTDTVKSLVDSQLVNTQINISNPEADVGLSQFGNYSGNIVTFIVTATNNGPDTATNINIKDLIPTGLTGYTVTPSVGSYNPITGIWSINSLINGASANLTLNGTSALQSTTNNTASEINQTEYNPTNPTTTLRIYTPAVNISVYNTPWYYMDQEQEYEYNYVIGNTPVFMWTAYNSGSYDEATGVVLT